jgi:hypothetical protein
LPSSAADSGAGRSTTVYGAVSTKSRLLGIRQAHREFAGGSGRQLGAQGETRAVAAEKLRRARR